MKRDGRQLQKIDIIDNWIKKDKKKKSFWINLIGCVWTPDYFIRFFIWLFSFLLQIYLYFMPALSYLTTGF